MNVLILGSRIPIKPEPINVELKVLMVGDARIYHVLYNYEEDFLKIFKVKAEFDSETKLTKDSTSKKKKQLLHWLMRNRHSRIRTVCEAHR